MNLFSASLDEIRLCRNLARPIWLELEWKRPAGWLSAHLPGRGLSVSSLLEMLAIERRASETAQLGEFPLHESYGQTAATRNSDAVRSSSDIGRLYRWLVVERKPELW